MTNDFKVVDEQLEAGRRAIGSYISGFVLSVVFTLIPYYIVVNHLFGAQGLVIATVIFGVIQLLVQVVFFLHLNKKSKPHWNMVVFFYTLLIVAFLVIGSLWIMYHLNYNMMGVSPFKTNEGYIPQ